METRVVRIDPGRPGPQGRGQKGFPLLVELAGSLLQFVLMVSLFEGNQAFEPRRQQAGDEWNGTFHENLDNALDDAHDRLLLGLDSHATLYLKYWRRAGKLIQRSSGIFTRLEPPVWKHVATTRRKRSGYMRLDPTAVELRRIGLGMSVKDLKDAATISDETWQRILKGEEIWMDSAVDVQNALGVKNLLEIMHPAKLAELTGMVAGDTAGPGLPDWQMEEPLSGRIETSNGLKYFTWKLKHRFEGNRFARGKRYDLSPLPTEEQKRLCNYLTRHGEVCNRVGGHPRFPRHLTTVPDPSGQSWWVVDEWIPGRSLAQVVLDGKFRREMLAPVMRQIAEGLKALHAAEVIRRELSPRFVLLRGER